MAKTVRVLAIAIALAWLVPSIASAQTYYAAIRGGPGWTPATNDGRPGFEDPSEHKIGATWGGAFGYAWRSGFSGEGEFGYIYAPVKSEAGVPLGGSIKSYPTMINVRYDARSSAPGLKPYAGFGLGAAKVNHNDEFFNSAGVKMQADEEQSAFAYQLRAGIACGINRRLDLSVGYHYVHTNGFQIEQGADRHLVNFDAVQNHSLEVGFALKF